MLIQENGIVVKEAPKKYYKKIQVPGKLVNYLTLENKKEWVRDIKLEINGKFVNIIYTSKGLLFIDGIKS